MAKAQIGYAAMLEQFAPTELLSCATWPRPTASRA